jgi:hypothetical protein
MSASRENELWAPEPLLDGMTVFCLGGGPSLAGFNAECLRGRRVIAINQSLYLAPWADLLFFMDTHWFEQNHEAVLGFKGVIVTGSRQIKGRYPDRVRRVTFRGKTEFEFNTPELKFSRSSGHAAIAVAIAMGAVRIVLLGYDMRRVDGRSHYHNAYGSEDDKLFSHDFLLQFAGWNEAARRCGVSIVNATPGSALSEFARGDLAAILRETRDER